MTTEMTEVEKDFQEFWASIVTVPETGELDPLKVKTELYDYHTVLREVPKVYDELTGGRLSKATYPAATVIQAVRETFAREVEEDDRGILFEEEPRIAKGFSKACKFLQEEGFTIVEAALVSRMPIINVAVLAEGTQRQVTALFTLLHKRGVAMGDRAIGEVEVCGLVEVGNELATISIYQLCDQTLAIADSFKHGVVYDPTSVEPPQPLEEIATSLNPGITATVAWLQKLGFETIDSGDGKTHDFGCDLPIPYVHMAIKPSAIVEDSRKLASALGLRGIIVNDGPDENGGGVHIQADYCPIRNGAHISLFNVDDEMLANYPEVLGAIANGWEYSVSGHGQPEGARCVHCEKTIPVRMGCYLLTKGGNTGGYIHIDCGNEQLQTYVVGPDGSKNYILLRIEDCESEVKTLLQDDPDCGASYEKDKIMTGLQYHTLNEHDGY